MSLSRSLTPTASTRGWQIPGIFDLYWDRWLILEIGLLLLLSFAVVYSASGQKTAVVMKHGLHVAVSFIIFVVIANQSPRTIKQWAPILYGAGLILLLGVLVLGISSKGCQRWINLGGIRFQPSEFLKLIVPLMLAYYLSDKPLPFKIPTLLVSLGIVGVPALLIAKQPDLGTAIQVLSTGCGVLFFAGLPWRWIFKISALAVAGLPLLWWKLHDYQRQRVMTLLNPESDPLNSGYHIIQSKIAIGSGGLYGKGWCQGTQAQLNFLPERTTDFIFSVLGEEFGFMGVAVLCLLYFAIVVRGIRMMTLTPDPFNRLVIGGIIFGFFMCFLINIGMVSGLLPVVGCPLPFMSYGGTALVTWMAAFGMLMAIYSQQRQFSR